MSPTKLQPLLIDHAFLGSRNFRSRYTRESWRGNGRRRGGGESLPGAGGLLSRRIPLISTSPKAADYRTVLRVTGWRSTKCRSHTKATKIPLVPMATTIPPGDRIRDEGRLNLTNVLPSLTRGLGICSFFFWGERNANYFLPSPTVAIRQPNACNLTTLVAAHSN